MEAIKLQRKISSDTLHIPELKKFLGKNVEIILLELPEKKMRPANMNKFIDAAGKIDIDEEAVAALREKSKL